MVQIQKIKTLLLALACTTAAIGFVVFMFVSMKASSIEFKESMQTLAEEQALEKEYVVLQNVLLETQEERDLLGTYILSGQDDAVVFLSEIDTTAARLGVELTTNLLKEVDVEDSPFDILQMSFTFKGSETSVVEMLQMFESLPYHGHISKFNTARTVDRATGAATASSNIELVLSIISE